MTMKRMLMSFPLIISCPVIGNYYIILALYRTSNISIRSCKSDGAFHRTFSQLNDIMN